MVFWALTMVLLAGGQQRAVTEWKQGPAFREQLQLPVSFVWSENPLRDALSHLADTQRTAIFLDRRLDPGYPVELTVQEQSLAVALRELAVRLDVDVGILDPVIYVGPPHVAPLLPTVAAILRQRAQALPAQQQRRYLEARSWRWEMLSTPRELVETLARQARVEVTNLDRLPHDLWPQVELPPLPWIDRLSLVLAGFDLTFTWTPEGQTIQLIDWPESAVLTRNYRLQENLPQKRQRIVELFPHVEVRRVGRRLEIDGSYEDHYQIDRLLKGQSVTRTQLSTATKRYHLKLENQPLRAILDALASQLRLTVVLDPATEALLDQRISLAVDNVTLDELLEKTLEPVGLTFQRTGRRIVIQVAQP